MIFLWSSSSQSVPVITKGFANCVAPRQRLWRLKHTTAENSWNFTSSIATSSSHGACSVANLFFPTLRHTPSFPAGHFSNLMSSTGPLMDLIAHLDLWETGSELAKALRYLRSSASPNFHGAAFGRHQLSKSDGWAPVSSWPLKLVRNGSHDASPDRLVRTDHLLRTFRGKGHGNLAVCIFASAHNRYPYIAGTASHWHRENPITHFAQLSRDPVVYFARLTQETCCSCPKSVREVFATPSSNTTLRKVCLALPYGPPVGQSNTYQLVASLHPKLLRKRVCFIQSRNLHVLHVNVEWINHRQRGLPLCCNHTAEDGRIRLQSEFVDLCEKVLCNQMPLLALKVWTCSNGRRQVVEVLKILKQMLYGCKNWLLVVPSVPPCVSKGG